MTHQKTRKLCQYIAVHMKTFDVNMVLSQEQLSERSGVPRSTIASLERGEGNPTLQVLVGIAQGLGGNVLFTTKANSNCCFIQNGDAIKVPKKLIDQSRFLHKNLLMYCKLTPETSRYLILQEYSLNEKKRFLRKPHAPGTEEYFYCFNWFI